MFSKDSSTAERAVTHPSQPFAAAETRSTWVSYSIPLRRHPGQLNQSRLSVVHQDSTCTLNMKGLCNKNISLYTTPQTDTWQHQTITLNTCDQPMMHSIAVACACVLSDKCSPNCCPGLLLNISQSKEHLQYQQPCHTHTHAVAYRLKCLYDHKQQCKTFPGKPSLILFTQAAICTAVRPKTFCVVACDVRSIEHAHLFSTVRQ